MDYTEPQSAADSIGGRTPMGWDIPSDVDYDLWAEAGIELSHSFDVHQWQFADWWNSGLWERGDRKAVVEDPRWRGNSFATCMNVGSVGKAFVTSRRREALSFTHHQVVRRQPEDKQDELLDWCLSTPDGEPRKSVRQLKQRLAEMQPDAVSPSGDGGVQKWAVEIGAWIMEQEDRMNTQRSLCERGNKFKVAAMDAVWELIKEADQRHQQLRQHAERGNGSTSSRRQDYTTPQDLADKLMWVVGGIFDVDPCSPTRDPELAIVKAHRLLTIADNGLKAKWSGLVYLNPPYGEAGRWVRKAVKESAAGDATVFGLLPVRTGRPWWTRYVVDAGSEVFSLQGRLTFGDAKNSAQFDNALIIWGGTAELIARVREAFPTASWTHYERRAAIGGVNSPN
jgi:hypothetical protein